MKNKAKLNFFQNGTGGLVGKQSVKWGDGWFDGDSKKS